MDSDLEVKPRVLKSTKILMVRSQSYLENGPIKNIMGGFYIPYFNPTIDFNMLQYISSSDSWGVWNQGNGMVEWTTGMD